jgi:putative protease
LAELEGRRKKRPLLLSPIKSFDGAVRVINAGADEVYCGVTIPGFEKFSLYRGSLCEIPNYDELGETVKFAKDNDVDVIVTINRPFMVDAMEKSMTNHIERCLSKEVDAFMVGDVGILHLVKEMGVDIPLYASTYFASMNRESVDFLRKLGFSRVVLERHLTIGEIKEIVKHSKIDVEIFLHGSWCSNTNVGCYLYHTVYPEMSQAVLSIDGIKLRCNLSFKVYDVDDEEEIIADTEILDAFRFCSICALPQILQTNVTGLKIVGRCIDESYQESTTKMYRELLDLLLIGDLKNYEKKVDWLRENFVPLEREMPLLRLNEQFCSQERCYYSPLFHAPYKIPLSWKTWTKHQFKFQEKKGT